MKAFKRLGPMSSFLILVVVFLLLSLIMPANSVAREQYNLSAVSYHILLFIVEIPILATWAAAFFGYYRLRSYTDSIRETREGAGFQRLTLGLLWLAGSLVIPTIISLLTNGITNGHPDFKSTSNIMANYLNLIFPLVAYTFIADGSNKLAAHNKRLTNTVYSLKPLLVLFAALSALYCFLAFRQIDLHHFGSSDNFYYVPVWLLLFTIIIPYLYAWFIGLSAVYELNGVAQKAKGVLYRQSLRLIAGGISLVIASSVGSQYLHTIMPRTGHLALDVVLLIIYIFYIFIALGFLLISLGASRLKRIEDI